MLFKFYRRLNDKILKNVCANCHHILKKKRFHLIERHDGRKMSGVDEFKVVTRRRRTNRFLRGVHRLTGGAENYREEPEIDIEQVVRQVFAAVEEIRNSGYGDILLNGLAESLKLIGAPAIQEIICYGLGNFSQLRSSKFQLAAVLTVKSHYDSEVHIYDPLFFSAEIEILKRLRLCPIDRNEEAKRVVGQGTSLVYMPHCPYQLTNNFIYTNWTPERLTNCIVLSNSFGELVDSIFLKSLEESKNFLARIQPYTTEIELKNSFEHEEIFNGSSVHIFLKEDLARVPENFWSLCEEPIYREENCEFVRQSVPTV